MNILALEAQSWAPRVWGSVLNRPLVAFVLPRPFESRLSRVPGSRNLCTRPVQHLVDGKLWQQVVVVVDSTACSSSSHRIKFTSVCSVADVRYGCCRESDVPKTNTTRTCRRPPLLLCESSFAAEISCIFDEFLVVVIMNWHADVSPAYTAPAAAAAV